MQTFPGNGSGIDSAVLEQERKRARKGEKEIGEDKRRKEGKRERAAPTWRETSTYPRRDLHGSRPNGHTWNRRAVAKKVRARKVQTRFARYARPRQSRSDSLPRMSGGIPAVSRTREREPLICACKSSSCHSRVLLMLRAEGRFQHPSGDAFVRHRGTLNRIRKMRYHKDKDTGDTDRNTAKDSHCCRVKKSKRQTNDLACRSEKDPSFPFKSESPAPRFYSSAPVPSGVIQRERSRR